MSFVLFCWDVPLEVPTGDDVALATLDAAHEALTEGRADDARTSLEAFLASIPEGEGGARAADALHLLALAHEELGDERAAVSHFLRVWEFDHGEMASLPEVERQALLDEVLRLAEASLASLPEEFRHRMHSVPLLVELLPSRDLVESGVDPRVLALIDGQDWGGQASLEPDPLPTRILLYAFNLASEFPQPADFEEQVHITVLHEVGHYFGLDEDDMVRLGLD